MTGLERLKEEFDSEPNGIAKLVTRMDIVLRMEEFIAEEAKIDKGE